MSASSLRILQLGPYPPPHGGVSANLVAIGDHLRAQGHAAGVVNLTNAQGRADDPAAGLWFPRSPWQTLRLMHRLPYDLLHLHIGGDVPPRVLALAAAVTAVAGRRSVLTFHSGGYPSSPAGQAAAPNTWRGRVFRRFDRIITVNQQLIDLFLRFGVPAERLRLILPFALPRTLPTAPLPPAVARFAAGHRPLVTSISGLAPEYDVALQIEAFGALLEHYPEAGLLILGSGPLQASLDALRLSRPYAARILLAGDLSHDCALRAVHESALFWRTTLFDGDAISVREALHLGVPVVATENGMRPSGVVTFPVRDAAGLVAASRRALAAGRRPALVRASSADDNMEQTLAVYRELLMR